MSRKTGFLLRIQSSRPINVEKEIASTGNLILLQQGGTFPFLKRSGDFMWNNSKLLLVNFLCLNARNCFFVFFLYFLSFSWVFFHWVLHKDPASCGKPYLFRVPEDGSYFLFSPCLVSTWFHALKFVLGLFALSPGIWEKQLQLFYAFAPANTTGSRAPLMCSHSKFGCTSGQGTSNHTWLWLWSIANHFPIFYLAHETLEIAIKTFDPDLYGKCHSTSAKQTSCRSVFTMRAVDPCVCSRAVFNSVHLYIEEKFIPRSEAKDNQFLSKENNSTGSTDRDVSQTEINLPQGIETFPQFSHSTENSWSGHTFASVKVTINVWIFPNLCNFFFFSEKSTVCGLLHGNRFTAETREVRRDHKWTTQDWLRIIMFSVGENAAPSLCGVCVCVCKVHVDRKKKTTTTTRDLAPKACPATTMQHLISGGGGDMFSGG